MGEKLYRGVEDRMLNVVSLDEALGIVRNVPAENRLGTETVGLDRSAGRFLAADVIAAEDVPSFERSTMDGFAVRAADTFGASAAIPSMHNLTGAVKMGEMPNFSVGPGECAAIPTGGMLPEGADAVVPVEYADVEGDLCLVYSPVSPLQNVTRPGDDVPAGKTVLCAGDRITTASVGVLAAMGITEVPVLKKPKAAVISTGDELVPAGVSPSFGQVRDVNSHILLSLCSQFGCDCSFLGIVKDDKAKLTDALRTAAEGNDFILLSGGSSAGQADITAEAIAELGEVYCHGIAVKPGKPTVLGSIGGKTVFGLPGHPTACWFMTEILVREHVVSLLGYKRKERLFDAYITENISSNHGREELLCIHLDGKSASPVYAKSGVISQLSAADGYIVIPRDSEGLKKGAEVRVRLI